MAEPSTEQRIVNAMVDLLRVQGYAATGVKQLAEVSGAPTGSIYHHFKDGKRGVAATALRQSGAVYIQLLPLLLDADPDLPTAIEAAFVTAAEDMQAAGWMNMCPIGTVTGEVADVEPELRAAAAEVMAMWIEVGTRYLAGRGLDDPSARELVLAVLTALEGAFVMARGLRSTEPLLAAGRSCAAYAVALLARQDAPAVTTRRGGRGGS